MGVYHLPMLKKVLFGLAALLLLAIGALAWLLQQHPSLLPYKALEALDWRAPPPAAAPAPLPLPQPRVSFLGVATLLIDDGETAILTDGFFSRPGKLQTFVGKVEPDLDAITRGLRRAGIGQEASLGPAGGPRVGRLAAVIPVHSHYDHAMDAPEVARRTGALLVGSSSTANIGRGWGLSEAQIRVATLGQPMQFGRFTVTLLPGRHAPTGFTGGEVSEPLRPPVRASEYKEGQSYMVLVRHQGRSLRSLLISGSAGFVPGALKGVRAEVVLLGIGTLGARGPAYSDAYWREAVAGVGARRVVPIHWDDIWLPAGQPMQPMPAPLDRFDQSMAFLRERGAKEGVDVRLPPQWQPMALWDGLPAP